MQRALADVQQLGNTVQEQLAAIHQLEAANKKLSSEAEVAFARTEKMQQNESMMELLQQALVGLQEDRRSMQVTCDVFVIFLCDVWRLTCVCRVLWSS